MIVFKSPKGWTGPKNIDGEPNENMFSFTSGSVVRFGNKSEHLSNSNMDEELQAPRNYSTRLAGLRSELAELAPQASAV